MKETGTLPISHIWYILNESVCGLVPVYDIACKLQGLPKDVIYDMAQKIRDDMHTSSQEINEEIRKQKWNAKKMNIWPTLMKIDQQLKG